MCSVQYTKFLYHPTFTAYNTVGVTHFADGHVSETEAAMELTGGCQQPGDPAPSGPPLGLWASEASCGAVSACRGSGTQRANPGALQRNISVCLHLGDPAPPLGALRRPMERCGGPGKGRNLEQNLGRTEDDGAATVERKPPGTPRRRTRHPRQP